MKQHTQVEQLREGQDAVGEDTARMKAAFTERTVTRLKEDNSRLQTKIKKLEEEITELQKDKLELKKQAHSSQYLLEQQKVKTAEARKALELRTRRYQSGNQNSHVSRGQKAHYERSLAQKDGTIAVMKDEYDLLNKKCHALMVDLQRLEKIKAKFEVDTVEMAEKEAKQVAMAKELESLYLSKVGILQTENSELKVQVESLILELKLNERNKQLEGLLTYQNRIGTDNPLLSHVKTTSAVKKSQLGPQTFREKGEACDCHYLQQQLIEQQQIYLLLKEKNERLEDELVHLRAGCVTLQNIICGG